MAKRKGEEWFIGGITNNTPRDLNLNLDFLSEGNHRMTLFRDGKNAGYQAMHYNKSEQTVSKGSSLSIHMERNGGFAATIK